MSVESPIKVLAAVGFSRRQPACDPDGAAMTFIRRLQEGDNPLEIAAVSVSGSCSEEALLAALAQGADRAVLVENDHADDPRAASLLLAGIVRREQPDLVFLGERTIEDAARQAGPRVAAILGWPHASGVREIVIMQDKKSCQVVREIDGMLERLQLAMPAVLDVHVAESEISLLSLYEIVAARSKPIVRLKGRRIAAVPSPSFTVLQSERAVLPRKCRMLGSVDELITALREEAHVI